MEKIKYSGIACYNVDVKLGRSEFSNNTGILVLETNHQPDYYAKASFPPHKHQNNWRLFVLVKNHIDCFQDVVLKKAYQIKQKLNADMEIMPGHMEYRKKSTLCIRINLSKKELLNNVIEELSESGISFVKDRKTDQFETEIFFKRYTELVEMEEGVYKDSMISGRYFFPINSLIEFDVFKKGIEKIKYSCNFHMFDSFLSFMFVDGGKGQDFIGIYSDHCDEKRFPELKVNIKNIFDV